VAGSRRMTRRLIGGSTICLIEESRK